MLPRVSLSCSNAAREALKAPMRSMSITVLKPLAESCSEGQMKLPAAPHTRTSTGPSSDFILASAASSADISRTSATAVQTLAPLPAIKARNSPAALSSFSWVRPQMAILAPSAAKFFAIPRLMPLPPPVTKTVLPLNRSLEKYEVMFMESPIAIDPGLTSVSYTHLRAHETRHDLVC